MTEKRNFPSREALRLRARARNKKPKFMRAESWKYERFSLSWRKPRGLDNKIRRKIKGWPSGPSMGYKGPKVARFLHPSGYQEVMVYNAANLSAIDPNTQAARIAHTVGKRKRAIIIEEAEKLNIKVLNMKLAKEAEESPEEGKEEAETEEAEEVKEPKKAEKKKEKPNKEKKTKPSRKKGEKKQ